MAAAAHAVYALVGNQLYSSPLSRDAWTRVGARTRYGPMTGSTLAVFGNSVWFGSNTYLWTTADGAHWARYPFSFHGDHYGLLSISAASPGHVAFLCVMPIAMFHNQKKVLVSLNGGRTERQVPSAPPTAGIIYGFAVAPGRFGVIAIAVVMPGPELIYRSANLGKTWTTVQLPDARHADLAAVHEPDHGLPRAVGERRQWRSDLDRQRRPDLVSGQVLSQQHTASGAERAARLIKTNASGGPPPCRGAASRIRLAHDVAAAAVADTCRALRCSSQATLASRSSQRDAVTPG